MKYLREIAVVFIIMILLNLTACKAKTPEVSSSPASRSPNAEQTDDEGSNYETGVPMVIDDEGED